MTFGRSKFRILQLICIGYIAVFLQFVDSSYNIALGKPASQSTSYGDWSADKAVDGTIGKDVTGGSCSATNPTGYREAWWRVDLQQMSRIKTINVTYRELYTWRLSGFYLYVSNVSAVDNLPNTAHLCYHDDTKDPDLPSINQSRSCLLDGQYVIFYNKRPADYGPKSHPYYSTTAAMAELCEVQVFGCPINHYGLGNCDRTCHCGVGGCDPDTGQCDVTGCQSGWRGPTCSEACRSETFGMNCNQTCHCSTPGCDRVTGSCTVPGCETGWQGHACAEDCGANRFGKNCFETCHCALPGCERVNGSCKHPGCEPGWKGIACDKVCTVGHFGQDCRQTCHCTTPGCDRFSGLCSHTGCDTGWEGLSCDKACDTGRYGKDCKHKCNCATTPGCDAITGNCSVPGCEAGWQGSTCNKACNTTSFGSNCDTTCHCATPGCDRFTGLCNVTGCDVGWTGSACDQDIANVNENYDNLDTSKVDRTKNIYDTIVK